MLDRVKGEIVFHCDGDDCDEVLETGERDFYDAKDVLKADGWRTAKAGEVWVHRCRGCQTPGWWQEL